MSSTAIPDKKLVRTASGLRIVPVDDSLRSPLFIDAPQWVPDNQCTICKACNAKFDFFQRRHHCRRCGECFCAKCCSIKLHLPRMCFVDPVLHCTSCQDVTNRENEFFDIHVKCLLQGAQLSVHGSVFGADAMLMQCKLAPNQRDILFDLSVGSNPFASYDPIQLSRIIRIDILSSAKESIGAPALSSVELTYKDTEEQTQTVQLTASDTSTANRKQGTAWLMAIIKAKKLINQNSS